MHLPVAVGHVNVADPTREQLDVFERRSREVQVRDVGVRLHRRVIDLPDQARERGDATGDRVLERLELDHDVDPARPGVLGELSDVLHHEAEDLVGREHLQVAVVLARDEHDAPPSEGGLLVDVRLATIEREPAHRRHEVHEPEGDAHGRANREPDLRARLRDRGDLVGTRRQRILEHVVGVEADLLRLPDPLDDGESGAVPRRADQSQLDHVATCSARAWEPGGSTPAGGRKSSVSKRLRSPRWTPTKYSIARPSSM